MIYALGVLVFLLGVAISIALHEVGHMVPAKLFGVKVPQYFVGFGPTLWSTKRGETEYGLKAFPLGGYVKLVGMLPPASEEEDAPKKSGRFSTLISDARAAEYEYVDPSETDRLLYTKPWWQKVIIMIGGPTVNLVIAFVLFCVVFIGFGVEEPTPTVSKVFDCAIVSTEAGRQCTDADPVSPAKIAGLEPGDTIVAFNGVPVETWDDLVARIRDNGDKTADITYVRDGVEHTTQTKTSVIARPDLDNPDTTVSVGFLGVSPTFATVHKSPAFVVTEMGSMIGATAMAIVHLPQSMVNVTESIFGGHRDENGPISVVGASRVAGELVTFDKPGIALGTQRILTLIAGLNLFLWLFNLIPLQPLDGGHIVGALWEGIRKGWSRLTGQADPGHVDVAKALPLAYVMWGALIIMGVILILADVVNPVTLL